MWQNKGRSGVFSKILGKIYWNINIMNVVLAHGIDLKFTQTGNWSLKLEKNVQFSFLCLFKEDGENYVYIKVKIGIIENFMHALERVAVKKFTGMFQFAMDWTLISFEVRKYQVNFEHW